MPLTLQDARQSEITPYLKDWIACHIEAAPPGHVPLLFVSGPQGAGKSTALAEAISGLSGPVFGASLDDFYLTRAERAAMARDICPLFSVRGPPGTHDLALLASCIIALRAAGPDMVTRTPVFDKLADDRAPEADWRIFTGQPAAIVIEGWLAGAAPDAEATKSAPINEVEAEDRHGAWRWYQEAQLATLYAEIWRRADGFFHIVPPDFSCVLNWRLEQEAALWQARGEAMPEARAQWTARFVQHYERITRRMIAGRRYPGTELHIDAERQVTRTSG
ncbi:kinase [Hyphomonas sp.]|uniref:kinase n=1 Tax=Hyphomonas sp. TaxID=87 RepID=UPI0039195782